MPVTKALHKGPPSGGVADDLRSGATAPVSASRRRVRWSCAGLAVVSLILHGGCSRGASADARRFPLTGVVVDIQDSPDRAVVAHETVPDFMPAMQMPFEIRGQAAPLRAGDRIAAALVVSDSRSWLEDVRVLDRQTRPPTRVPMSSRAAVGARVPDLPLVDQDGAPITLRDGDGRVRVITFIYTRCPLPDFCPLMVKHLETVRRRSDAEGLHGRVAFVGITLDPSFDTPAVLRAFGASVLTGEDRFNRWTLATGTARQVQDAARFFGVGYRSDEGILTHTLMTAVVSPDGRIARLLESNAWRPDDLFEVVRRTAGSAAFQ